MGAVAWSVGMLLWPDLVAPPNILFAPAAALLFVFSCSRCFISTAGGWKPPCVRAWQLARRPLPCLTPSQGYADRLHYRRIGFFRTPGMPAATRCFAPCWTHARSCCSCWRCRWRLPVCFVRDDKGHDGYPDLGHGAGYTGHSLSGCGTGGLIGGLPKLPARLVGAMS